MKLKLLLASGAAAIALASAQSANANGYYVGIFGGWATFNDDLNFSTSGSYLATTTGSITILGYNYVYTTVTFASYGASWSDDFDNGWVIGAALGYDFGTGLRSELEFAYRSFDIDSGINVSAGYYGYYGIPYVAYPTGAGTTFTGVVGPYTTAASANFSGNSSGDVSVWSLMMNLWYDFDMGGPIMPFIGGGVGVAQMNVDYSAVVTVTFTTVPTYGTTTAVVKYAADGDDFVFAYQFGGGLAYEFAGGAVLSAQYRYFGTTDADVGSSSIKAESHNFLLGLAFPLQ